MDTLIFEVVENVSILRQVRMCSWRFDTEYVLCVAYCEKCFLEVNYDHFLYKVNEVAYRCRLRFHEEQLIG